MRGIIELTYCGYTHTVITGNKLGSFRTRILPKNFPHIYVVHSFQFFVLCGRICLSLKSILKKNVPSEA